MTSTEPISVRDFLRNFAAIVQGRVSKRYIIMKHGRPIGVFTPWEVQKQLLEKKAVIKANGKKEKTFFEELKELQFNSGDPHLSENVDEIVYGIGRNTYPH